MADLGALLREHMLDTWAAVEAEAVGVDLLHSPQQGLVPHRAFTGLTLTPGVEACGAHDRYSHNSLTAQVCRFALMKAKTSPFDWIRTIYPADQYSVTHLLAPHRKHERVNAQGIRNVLDLHPGAWLIATAPSLNFTPYRLTFFGPSIP